MANKQHNTATGADLHTLVRWTVANNAALAALTVASTDIGKLAWQQDTNTYYVLVSNTGPVWQALNSQVTPPQPNTNSQLMAGGGISYEGNLDFLVAAAVYQIVGQTYTSPQTSLTLANGDASDPRIDAIVLNTSGAAVVVQGTPAANPSTPSIDPATQLAIGYVLVPANATTIDAAVNTLAYDENAGTGGGEWATAALSGSWDFANTANPLHLTKDILGAAITVGQGMSLTPAAAIDLSTYLNGVLVLPIRVVSAWANNRGLTVSWFKSGAQVGIPITVTDGVYGFSRTLTSAYQYVVIPLVNFGITPGTTVDSLHIVGYGGTIALRLDWIRVQGAAVTQTTNGLTQAQADARYLQIANDLSEIAAQGATAQTNARTNIGAAPLASPTFTGATTAPELSISGLTGAATASRYVGGVAGAAPTSGTFSVGDFVVDTTLGGLWTCLQAGTPGVWVYAGPATIVNHQTGTSYEITLADWGKVINCDNGSPFTLTMPANDTTPLPQGFWCSAYQGGAGKVTVVVTTDTLRSPNGASTAGQYKMINITKVESATVTTVTGDSGS